MTRAGFAVMKLEGVKEMFRVGGLRGSLAGRASRGAARFAAAWLSLLCVMSSPQALAQHRHVAASRGRPRQQAATKRPGVIEIGESRLSIPDVRVLDQDGREVRLYSDLIRGKVVVVSFFFTNCSFICPMQGRALAKLQAGLGGRLGRDVFFVSVSKDPATDRPERLARWGANFRVGRGWTLVTGGEDVMKRLLLEFTGDKPGPRMHGSVILIGNDRTGVWEAADGLSATEELVELIDRVSAPAASPKR